MSVWVPTTRIENAFRAALDHAADDVDPDPVALAMLGADLDVDLIFQRAPQSLHVLRQLGHVFGMHQGMPRIDARRQRVWLQTQHGQPAFVDAQSAARDVPVPYAEIPSACPEPQRRLTLTQGVIGLLARGHIARDADKVGRDAGVVEHWRNGQLVPERSTVLAVIDDLARELHEHLHPLADAHYGLGVGQQALHESASAADHF